MDIQTALVRLNSHLPLKARQNRLPQVLKTAHQRVLACLITQGRPPSAEELETVLGQDNLTTGLQRLAAEDLVVLDAKGKHVVGAYPVTIERTPHKISVHGHSIYAMCALDAVAVAPMFATEVRIDSGCHVSKTPISIHMSGRELLEVHPTADVVVGIRWQMPSAVAAHSMCTQMVFLKDRQVALDWQQGDSENISLFSLPEAVAFAEAFFLPLLD